MNLTEIKQTVFAIKELTGRELKRKYARSFMGILWSALNPVLLMIVVSILFSTAFHRNVDKYPFYYYTGFLFFEFFSIGTTTSITAIVDNKSLLMKVKLPKQAFVFARVYTAFINMCYCLAAYVMLFFIFDIKLSWTTLLFPLVMLAAAFFVSGIALFLSVLYVFFADIKHFYSIIVRLFMYFSALFYSVDAMNDLAKFLISLNPLYVYIYIARCCVMYNEIPSAEWWIKMAAYSILTFSIGWGVFRWKENAIMQKL